MRQILENIRVEIHLNREAERTALLARMTDLLCWMTIETPITRANLLRLTLAWFDRELETLPGDSSVRKMVDHYRTVAEQQTSK
jgi:hypothetical protein